MKVVETLHPAIDMRDPSHNIWGEQRTVQRLYES